MFKNMFEEIGDPTPTAQQVSGIFLTCNGVWLRAEIQTQDEACGLKSCPTPTAVWLDVGGSSRLGPQHVVSP